MEFICDNEKENWEPGDEAKAIQLNMQVVLPGSRKRNFLVNILCDSLIM